MDDQNKNLLLATALSFGVILVWFYFFPPPEQELVETAPPAGTVQTESGVASAPTTGGLGTTVATTGDQADVVEAPRLELETDRLEGSISLTGGRIDDLRLKDYRVSLEEEAEIVQMLEPVGSDAPYYALYGWAPKTGVSLDQLPGANTEWSVESGTKLGTESPVTLRWDSPAGLVFRRTISIDPNFMFSVTQSVENTSAGTVELAPYGLIARHGEPQELKNFFILFEGAMQMTDGILEQTKYSKITDLDVDPASGAQATVERVTETGWVGFTDHYWMSTLIPENGTAFKSTVKYDASRDIYQTEVVLPVVTLANGESSEVTTQLFAGAKEWAQIRAYEKSGIDRFLDSIDWGWFFFLTKPIFAVLHYINEFIGNMGWAIIGLTLLIKAVLLPLAFKSYVSMAKMKELQPEMEKIKERTGDDRQKLQQEMMALYKEKKVNPASGCLPLLLQIPIFFSLYKVIFVTLELRHAPWIGWINDLSAPDPSSILNLFGLFPWGVPDPASFVAVISLGVLPIILGISMWLQQKLNPAPTDPTQAMIIAWMPWVFMFMLGTFASGLVIYWIANNLITFSQQYLIMRSQGYKPDVLGNILGSFKRKKSEE